MREQTLKCRARLRLGVFASSVAVVTLLCFACLGYEGFQVRNRNAMRRWIIANEGLFVVADREKSIDQIGLLRSWLGDESIELLVLTRNTPQADLAKISAAFPELNEPVGVWRRAVFTNRRQDAAPWEKFAHRADVNHAR